MGGSQTANNYDEDYDDDGDNYDSTNKNSSNNYNINNAGDVDIVWQRDC